MPKLGFLLGRGQALAKEGCHRHRGGSSQHVRSILWGGSETTRPSCAACPGACLWKVFYIEVAATPANKVVL